MYYLFTHIAVPLQFSSVYCSFCLEIKSLKKLSSPPAPINSTVRCIGYNFNGFEPFFKLSYENGDKIMDFSVYYDLDGIDDDI
jgi:hypothetical protein